MGIIAKAMRKSQLEAAKTAPEEPKPTAAEPAVRTGEAPPAAPPKAEQPSDGLYGVAAAQRAAAAPPAAAVPVAADKPKPAAAPAPQAGKLALALSAAGSEKAPSAAKAAEPPVAEIPLEPAVAPAAKRDIDPSMVSILDPEGPEAELFRMLRTRILFPQSGRPPRTILVTSALAEEGKSFVAANLAVNIAQNVDEHVLLVDSDLRKPSIHGRFGFNGVKGLSEYLANGVALASLLVKTSVGKLTLLPAGAPPANPSELITSAKMAALVEELKARYDDRYIIIDSPPPMMAPETSALAQWVDGILVVARYGSTPMGLLEELMTHLDREKVIGAVINRIHPRDFQRYVYKKYYNKYRQYQKGR